jgi:hypothetical protein
MTVPIRPYPLPPCQRSEVIYNSNLALCIDGRQRQQACQTLEASVVNHFVFVLILPIVCLESS